MKLKTAPGLKNSAGCQLTILFLKFYCVRKISLKNQRIELVNFVFYVPTEVCFLLDLFLILS